MAANSKRATKVVTGLLLEANWKDNTAEIYPDEGPAVKVAFPDELADEIQRAARHRVHVAGRVRRPRNGRQHLAIDDLEVLDSPSPLAGLLERSGASAPAPDPFEGAKPLQNVWELIGELPDDRSAEEIIEDIRACRATRRPPYDEEE
jgi:hypothetical protein